MPRAPGLRGQFAGRELRRGMEREMGRTFLSRLESTAVQGVQGDGAPLSPSSIARLRNKWIVEYNTWRTRRLDHRELVYAWADGIYVKAGLEKQKAALLVVIGAMSDGRKEILTIVPGYRESTESWTDVLRDLRDRGLTAPVLLAADGHLGIWAGLAEIWPHTAEQRCWNHRILNVLRNSFQGNANERYRSHQPAPCRASSASDPVWNASGQPPWASMTSSISAMIRMVSFRATTIF